MNSNGGSAKHTMTIDALITRFFDDTDHVILIDNDAYLINDIVGRISGLDFQNDITIAEPYKKKKSIK